jgi:hypothetical protein
MGMEVDNSSALANFNPSMRTKVDNSRAVQCIVVMAMLWMICAVLE